MRFVSWGAALAVLTAATPAMAQTTGDAAAPDRAGPAAVIEIDPAALKMPELTFAATPADEADYEKYFYFHRAETDYATAYADIRECDALSSGSNIYLRADAGSVAAASAQYGMLAGALGGAIGGAIADAIFGSAARRAQRRVNLRNCMHFKDYARYPLTGDLWKKFNFEEGHGRKKECVRDEALELQALVASGLKPATRELGL